ncbi:MAG: Xaa-Pro peptidase family protein [bacterium]|nr:Xaa-Pro peptidase family protein [bacterium]
MDKRRSALHALITELKADALLISDMNNVRYFSGFTGSSASMLCVGEATFFLTDGRYRTQASEEVKGAEIVIYKSLLDSLEELLLKLNIASLAFEAEDISYARWSDLKDRFGTIKLLPVKEQIRNIRRVKETGEIEIIKRGTSLAKETFLAVRDLIKPGAIESDIALAFEIEAKKRGASKLSFDIIVASGARSALPHASPTDKVIIDGDLVVVDFGIVLDGYSTDETCTFRVGKVGPELNEIYEIVKEAHDRAIALVKPGVKAADVDNSARKHVVDKGYGDYFIHGTGHGVGLQIHELPTISERSEELLEEGMVFTVEPGIYVPERGGVRIEDMILVTADGCEVLTHCNKFM